MKRKWYQCVKAITVIEKIHPAAAQEIDDIQFICCMRYKTIRITEFKALLIKPLYGIFLKSPSIFAA
jgi:hypothetical protein